jgi:hypothetical protein
VILNQRSKTQSSVEFEADWERGEHGRFHPYGKTNGQAFQEQE